MSSRNNPPQPPERTDDPQYARKLAEWHMEMAAYHEKQSRFHCIRAAEMKELKNKLIAPLDKDLLKSGAVPATQPFMPDRS